MAEFLCDFFDTVEEDVSLDVSFSAFKDAWRKHRLTHIFLIQFKEEPFHAFTRELFDYVVDRLHREVENPVGQRDRVLAYGVFALYTLYRCQPYQDQPKNKQRISIFLPLWTWKMMSFLAERFKTFFEPDAYQIMLYLFQIEAFIFCLERPIDYRPQSSFPYPKNGQVFCNNDPSQAKIAPSTLWTSVDIKPLKDVRQEYEGALKSAGTGLQTDVTLDQRLRKELKTFEKFQTKISKGRKKRQREYLDHMKMDFFYQAPPPLTANRKREYYEMCAEYDQADAHLPPIDGSPINMDAILNNETNRTSPLPRRKSRRNRGSQDTVPPPNIPPAFPSEETEVTGPPRRKKRKTSSNKRRSRRKDDTSNSSMPNVFDVGRIVKEENISPTDMDFTTLAPLGIPPQHPLHHHTSAESVPMTLGDTEMLPPTVTELDPSLGFGFDGFGGLQFDTMGINGTTGSNDNLLQPNLNMGMGGLQYPFLGFQDTDLTLSNGTAPPPNHESPSSDGNEAKRKSRKRQHSQVEDYGKMENGSDEGDDENHASESNGDSFDVNGKGTDVMIGNNLDLPGLNMTSQYLFPNDSSSFNYMNGLLAQTSDSLSINGPSGFPMSLGGIDGDKPLYGMSDWNHPQPTSSEKPSSNENFHAIMGQLDSVLMKSMRFQSGFGEDLDQPLETLGGNDFSLGSSSSLATPTNGLSSAFDESDYSALNLRSDYGSTLRPPVCLGDD